MFSFYQDGFFSLCGMCCRIDEDTFFAVVCLHVLSEVAMW